MERSVYLDYAATTPIDDRVLDAYASTAKEFFANPNSLYTSGRAASAELERARESIASQIGAAQPSEVVFTGGGTESDNTAVVGIARAARNRSGRDHIVVSAFEHKAVLEPAEYLAKNGFRLDLVSPRSDGVVHPEDLEALVGEKTALVSVMHVNNELGTVQPIAELAAVTHAQGALFHTDAVQSVGKLPFDAGANGVDAASFSAHKFYGPRGVGALYLKRGTPLEPLLIGGGQESKRRSGTQNVAGAAAFDTALRLMTGEQEEESVRLTALRDHLIDGVLEGIENTELNGDRDRLAPHIVNLLIKGVEGEAMLLQLDSKGMMVSTGSACSSGSLKPSHVLLAIGCPPELAHGSLRLSLGRFTTEADIDYFLQEFPLIVERLRAMSPVYSKMYG